MSAHPPASEACARWTRDRAVARGGVDRGEGEQLLRTELEQVCGVLAPYCAGLVLRVRWTPPKAQETTREVSCPGCRHWCLSGSLETVAERCCACVQGGWRSWLPLVVQRELWGVLSLCSETEEAPPRQDNAVRELNAGCRWFQNAVRLAAALVAGCIARVENVLLERTRTRAARRVPAVWGSVRDRGEAPPPRVTPPSTARLGDRSASELASRMLALIREDGSCSITLKELGNRLSRNPAYLSGLFAREVGVPFKRFLTELRLGKARGLLLDPGRSITEIATAVGYASEERFRAAFKQAAGCSPLYWRTHPEAGTGSSPEVPRGAVQSFRG